MVAMRIPRIPLGLLAAGLLLVPLGGPASADTTVRARLQAVNESGVSGVVTLTGRSDGSLTVAIRARGLVPGVPHAQHIHGSVGGEHFMCPSAADDTDGDGVLTNEEAAGEYGTIFLSLTTRGSASPDSGLALDRMPVATSSGELQYRRTFAPDQVPDELLSHLADVHIVVHGIDANGNDTYDLDALGESTFAKNLGLPNVPEEGTNPAACGVVTGAGAPLHPEGGPETGGAAPEAGSASPSPVGGIALIVTAAVLLVGAGLRRGPVRRES